MTRNTAALLMMALIGCGAKEPGGSDTGTPVLDGGSTDGGTTDGGSSDGGTPLIPTDRIEAQILDDDAGHLRIDGSLGQQEGGQSVAWAGDADGDGFDDVLVGNAYGASPLGGSGLVSLVSGGGSDDLVLPDDAAITFAGVDTADTLGDRLAGLSDLDNDGFDDFAISQRDRTNIFLGPGPGSSAWATDDAAHATIAGSQLALVSTSDVDGDDLPDLLVGAPEAELAGDLVGAVLLMSGTLSGERDASDALHTIWGDEVDGYAATQLAVGDTNGDSLPDLIVGSSTNACSGRFTGRLHEVSSPFTSITSLSDADNTVCGAHEDSIFGHAVATGLDIDGDGYADVAATAPYFNNGDRNGAGRLYLFMGSADGALSAAPQATLDGADSGDHLGRSLGAAGDPDGDGFDDVVVGAPEADAEAGSGAAYLIYGPVSGSLEVLDTVILSTGGATNLGSTVAGTGDWNGDGYKDLLIGAPYGGPGGFGTDGRTWVLLGGGL